MTDTEALNPEQQQRAQAVMVASRALTAGSGTLFAGGKAPKAGALVYVAEWIVEGTRDAVIEDAPDRATMTFIGWSDGSCNSCGAPVGPWHPVHSGEADKGGDD